MINKTSLYDIRWINIVFHNRNKAYGAYLLRLEYAKNMTAGILTSVGLFVLLFGLTLLPEKPVVVPDMNYKDVLYVQDIVLPAKADAPQPVTVVRPSKPIPNSVRKDVFIIKPEDALKTEQPPAKDPQPNDDNGSEGNHPEGSNNSGGPGTVPGGSGSGGEGSKDQPFDDHKPMLIVDQMPEFPGGEAALIKYIKDNTKYPQAARSDLQQGTVYVSFVVGRSGEVEDVKILKGIGRACDEAAMNIIKSLPKFSPGKQNGKAVRVQYNIPIKFKLAD